MEQKISISFAESALHDLEGILQFYLERKIPQVGKRLVEKIIKDIELLELQPDMGRIVPEFDQEYLRELIRPPFRIVYRRGRNKIQIIRIWRSERMLVLPED